MARFWPTADSDPASTEPMVEFAGIWRDMPKIVCSRTLEQADWNAVVARTSSPPMRQDLIDEYRLYVHPVVIGQGKPRFQPSAARTSLQLSETRGLGNGVVLLHYRRPGASGGFRAGPQEVGWSHAAAPRVSVGE